MKCILSSIFILFLFSALNAQMQMNSCEVTISGPSQVCPGVPNTWAGTGILTQANQGFDFNNSQIPAGWQSSGGTNYGVYCVPSPDNTPFFWASTSSGTPHITTAGFDVCSGGTIDFQMRYAIQGQASPCEGPDEKDEGVSLQYSVNNGPWVDIIYYSPGGFTLPSNPGGNQSIASGNTAYTVWNNFSVPIPPGAISTNTKFRWIQTQSSGGCCDNWGLDNVYIQAGPCLNGNIGWDGNGSNTASTDNITLPIYSDTVLTAILYDDNGDSLCQSQPFTVTVFNPYINGGADQTVCYGQSVTLSASQGTNFTWNNNVTNGVAFNPTSTATYIVNGIDNNGCAAKDTVIVNVNPLINYTLTYPNGAFCIDGNDPYPTLSETLNGSFSISPTTVSIDPVTGIVDLSTSTTNTTQTYTVSYTPTNACYATATAQFSISVAPTVAGGPDQIICRNDQVTLSATGANSYQWTGGVVNNTPFAPTATAQYIVTGFNQYGCTDTDTVLVTVNQLPPVVAINDVAICRGDSTVLLATGAPSYTWTGGIQNGDYVSPSQTTTYYVTGTAANGCKKTDSVLVFVHQLPMIDAGPETTVCLNFPYIPKGAYGVQYEWSHNATNEQPVFLPLGNNWMYVIGTDANGCSNTDSVLVHVIKPPVTHFTPDKYVGYPGTVFTFTNNSENANSYYWDFANGSNTTTHSVTQDVTSQYSAEGDYIVVLTADNGVCKYPYQDTVHIIPFPDPTIFVPNVFTPNNDGANDRFFLTVEWGKQIEVIILNRWGNHMATITDFNQGWDGRTMNGQEATEGVYFYKYEILGFNNKTYTGHGFVTLER